MPAAAEVLSSPHLHPLLASIWQRNLPLIHERVALLSVAATQTSAGHLTPSARRDACDIAHKLAGSLGMFGYPQGTQIARQLEVLLDAETPVLGDQLSELTSALRLALAI